MGAVGLQTHIWANNTRSILLLGMFPVLLVAMGILLGLALMIANHWISVRRGYGAAPPAIACRTGVSTS